VENRSRFICKNVSRETMCQEAPTVDMTKDSFCPIRTDFENLILLASAPSIVWATLVDKPDLLICNANADDDAVSVRHVRTE